MAIGVCRACGSQVSINAKLCPQCGVRSPTVNNPLETLKHPQRRAPRARTGNRSKVAVVLGLLFVIGLIAVSTNSWQTPADDPSEPVKTSAPQSQGTAITAGGPNIDDVKSIGGELYNHGFILEFEPNGRPFQTTKESRDANRKNRVGRLQALRLAASRQDSQIASDITFLQIAKNVGHVKDQDTAAEKLVDDLDKIRATITGKEVISFDPASPWGQIISQIEERLAYDDKSEEEDKRKQDTLRQAAQNAGVLDGDALQDLMFGQALALAHEVRLGVSPYLVVRALKEASWKSYPRVNAAVENWIRWAKNVRTAKTAADFASLSDQRKNEVGNLFHSAITEVVITNHADDAAGTRSTLEDFIAGMQRNISGIETSRAQQGLSPLKPMPHLTTNQSVGMQ